MSTANVITEHCFSVELSSKEHVKKFTILNGAGSRFLVEGFLGELQQVTLVEGLMLEVKGSNGILRLDMTEAELRKALFAKAGVDEVG